MTYFGIPGHRPVWIAGARAIAAAHAARLRGLAGRRLDAAWVVWDLDDDTWFADCPVVFSFGGTQVEVNHQKFDELSITWDTIDVTAPIVEVDPEVGFRLEWRRSADPRMVALYGSPLTEAVLLAWGGRDMAQGMTAVGFAFPSGNVAVTNALDENAVEFGPFDPGFWIHRG
ncbi:hypothetical protein GCM10022221_58300 [Actinocorallia aurea]